MADEKQLPLMESIFGSGKTGFAVALLSLISKHWGQGVEFIYGLIPDRYKDTMTLEELMDAIKDGIQFYGSVTKLFTK